MTAISSVLRPNQTIGSIFCSQNRQKHKNPLFNFIFKIVSLGLFILLAACGGASDGSGGLITNGGGGGGGETTKGSLVISLTNTAGENVTVIPQGGYLLANALVKTSTGATVENQLVTFSVSNSAGVLGSELGTALTDNKGMAQVTLQPGTASGAGTLSASTTLVSEQLSATIGFSSKTTAATGSPKLTMALINADGCEAASISSTCALTAMTTLTNSAGSPISNALVSFTSDAQLSVITPSFGTIVTDQNGTASVSISPVNLETAINQIGTGGQVSASATVEGETVTAGQIFRIGATTVSLKLNSPISGKSDVAAYGTSLIEVAVYSNGAIYKAKPVAVDFSSSCQQANKASFNTTVNTINGIAQITYVDNGCASIDVVTASIAGAPNPVNVTLNVAEPQSTSINFISAIPSDKSIVIQGAGGTGRSSIALLTFKVVDSYGLPKANAPVTFTSNVPTNIALLNTVSNFTDAEGQVVASVSSGSNAGTFRITASVDNTNPVISSISDSVIVSTGQPIQASMTLAVSTFNIEGWNVISPTTITAYLSDQNGNPVADGTPVSFTTLAGQVGTSEMGGCLTNNGACAVTYKSTNPRPTLSNGNPRDGIAQVMATSANQTTVALGKSVNLTISGSEPYLFYQPTLGSGSWYESVGSGAAQISTSSCNLQVPVFVSDLNKNTLPLGTTMKLTTIQDGLSIGALMPSAVPNVGFPNGDFIISGFETVYGTQVVMPITVAAPSPICNEAGVQDAGKASVTLIVKTPLGVDGYFNIDVRYPA